MERWIHFPPPPREEETALWGDKVKKANAETFEYGPQGLGFSALLWYLWLDNKEQHFEECILGAAGTSQALRGPLTARPRAKGEPNQRREKRHTDQGQLKV